MLPIQGDQQTEEELNRFLRSHRILQVERHFCSENGGYWALMVEYVDGDPTAEAPPTQRRERKDFSEGLTDEEKQRYENYKVVRRELAQQHNIPAYLVFTNEELSILSRLSQLNDETVRGVKGIAPQRLKDYVRFFYDVSHAEASGELDVANSQPGESA